MGTSWFHVTPGTPTLEVLRRELNSEKCEIVASCIKPGAAYLAIRIKETGQVMGSVALIQRDSKEYNNFGLKWVDEDMGPYHIDASLKVLNALTPTDNQWANEWRERCRAKLNRPNPNKGVDLTGKRVKLYSKFYKILGKHEVKGAWSALGEHDGYVYKLKSSQVKLLEVTEVV